MKHQKKERPDTGDNKKINESVMQQKVNDVAEKELVTQDIAIPLPIQEIAFMIVNKVYETPDLLEGLIKSVEVWILHNLSESHITELLTNPTEIISKELNGILLESLTSLISDLAEVNEKKNG